MSEAYNVLTEAALTAHRQGYTPIPIKAGSKAPDGIWKHLSYDDEAEVIETFGEHGGGLGIALGEASGGLVDVDLDSPKARRLATLILPPTAMQSGRPSSRWSHRWYRVTGEIPSTRQYVSPDNGMIVEMRSTGGQTVVPPSVHPDGEAYLWEGEAWGGDEGPAEIDARVLGARVATLAMLSLLLEVWPTRGSRHNAYLALVGGLVRTRQGVHPLWEKQAAQIVGTLADATNDEDGAAARISEAVPTTIEKIREGVPASGWPTLAEIIGEPYVEKVRHIARDIEHLLGWGSRAEPIASQVDVAGPSIEIEEVDTNDAPRSPLEERTSTWEPVDLGPYLTGDIEMPEPGVFFREDGRGLFYPGRVNMIYAKRESGKSWVTLAAAVQSMGRGERVLFVDMEDEPDSTIARLRALGADDDMIRKQFVYLHPEDPITAMTPLRYGEIVTTERKQANDRALSETLAATEPALVIVDGMTVLYALHGLSSNDGVETDRISAWLRSLTRRGESSVIIVDHVRKSAGRTDDPIGSQHKMAMVSGVAYHVWPASPLRIGRTGRVELVVGKDRIGAIRKEAYSEGPEIDVAGVIEFSSSEDGVSVTPTVREMEPGEVAAGGEIDGDSPEMDRARARLRNERESMEAQRRALEALEGQDFESMAAWRRVPGIGTKATQGAVDQGYVTEEPGRGTAKIPMMTEAGRERLEWLREHFSVVGQDDPSPTP